MGKVIIIDELIEKGLEIADPYNCYHTDLKYNDPFIKEKKDKDSRDPFERDYARVIHSASFRRLQGKMQLLGTQTSDFFRTRLTHSLEVSQIGSEIATKIKITTNKEKRVSKALVAMACLAHDIGNPPFGHFGEKALNVLMKDYGGFEGNAQTLRIVCKLEKKSQEFDGLNLTQASRMALVKYNVTASEIKKRGDLLDGKFLYNDQREEVFNENGVLPQSIECQIMELADDIAYACHDLEDSLKSGVLTIEDILWSLGQKGEDVKAQFEEILMVARDLCGNSHGDIFLKSITSVLINKFVNDIGIVQLEKKDIIKKGTEFSKGLGMMTYAELLKHLKLSVYDLLVRQPTVAEYEINGGIIVKEIFSMLVDEKYNYKYRLFPLEFQQMILKNESDEDIKARMYRAASDYISGMTDTFAMRLYKKHFGKEMPTYSDCSWEKTLP